MLEFDGTLIFKQTNIIRVQNSITFYSFSIQTLKSFFLPHFLSEDLVSLLIQRFLNF